MKLGKCPKCDTQLTEEDIDELRFKGLIGPHLAYRRKICDYIIGFSSMFRS